MGRQFSALRGLAILLVLLHHSITFGISYLLELGYPRIEGVGHWILLVLKALGSSAVPTFLFISGGFVAYATRGNPARFTWKAVRTTLNRILWPYLLWSLVSYAVVYVLHNERSSLPIILKNLVIGYPYHFIPLLAFYYLAAPVLVASARRWGWVVLTIIALIQLTLLNLVSPGILGFVFPGWVRTIVPRYYNAVFAPWGIYFPLGVVCGLNANGVVSWARRFRRLLLPTMLALFLTHVLSAASVLHFSLSGHIWPVAFVFLSLIIDRNWIPRVRTFEQIGKGSYGLYLIHLNVLLLALPAVHFIAPWLLEHPVLFYPTLFLLAMQIPLLLMKAARSLLPGRACRYVFG